MVHTKKIIVWVPVIISFVWSIIPCTVVKQQAMSDPIPDPLAISIELVLVLRVIDLRDKFIEICLVDFQHVGVE